jgi:hypothetical protein
LFIASRDPAERFFFFFTIDTILQIINPNLSLLDRFRLAAFSFSFRGIVKKRAPQTTKASSFFASRKSEKESK